MTKSEWQDALYPLIARVARIDPIQAERHPAFKGALRRIDRLIEYGLQHDFISDREAVTL